MHFKDTAQLVSILILLHYRPTLKFRQYGVWSYMQEQTGKWLTLHPSRQQNGDLVHSILNKAV
jgi:hypothetical protein